MGAGEVTWPCSWSATIHITTTEQPCVLYVVCVCVGARALTAPSLSALILNEIFFEQKLLHLKTVGKTLDQTVLKVPSSSNFPRALEKQF